MRKKYDDLTIWMCLLILIFAVGCSALCAYILMLFWNWLAPLFWKGAPILTFLQAWGASFLLHWIGMLIFKRW